MTAVRLVRPEDLPGLLAPAAEGEHWFGPTAAEPGFHHAVRGRTDRGLATVAEDGEGLLGGLPFGAASSGPRHLHWLGVAGHARGAGVGREGRTGTRGVDPGGEPSPRRPYAAGKSKV